MKTITVRDLQKRIRECIGAAQEDAVVVTRHGKPAAVLIGVEGADWESLVLQTSASFWKTLARRRKEKTVTLQEIREALEGA